MSRNGDKKGCEKRSVTWCLHSSRWHGTPGTWPCPAGGCGDGSKNGRPYEMAGSGWEVLLLIFWTAKMFLKLSSNLASSWSPSLTNLWFWKSKDKNSKSHGQWAEAPKVSDNLGLRFRLPPKVKWDFIQGRIAYVPWSFDHFPLSRRQRSKNSTILQPNSSSEIDRST